MSDTRTRQHARRASTAIAARSPKPACGDRERVVVGGRPLETLRAAVELELRRADRADRDLRLTTYPARWARCKAIRALGLDIPGDVSLLGFDDFDWMTAAAPLPQHGRASRSTTSRARCVAADATASTASGEPLRCASNFPAPLRCRESTGPAAAAEDRRGDLQPNTAKRNGRNDEMIVQDLVAGARRWR